MTLDYCVQVLTASGWEYVSDPETFQTDREPALACVMTPELAREARLHHLMALRPAFLVRPVSVVILPCREAVCSKH